PEIAGGNEKATPISYPRIALAGIFVSLLYPVAGYARYLIAGQRPNLLRDDLMVSIWSAILHVLLFLLVFILIELASRLAEHTPNPGPTRFILLLGVGWLGFAVAFYKVILASIPFTGTEAMIYAGVFSLAGTIFVGGFLLRRRQLYHSGTRVMNRTALKH